MFTELKGVAEHLISPISSMTIDGSGKYLFVSTTSSPLTHTGGNTIVSHSIHPTTGLLTPINEQQDGYQTFRLSVTPDGKYLHAASFGRDAIYRYEINQGRLSKGVIVANTGIDILDFLLVNETCSPPVKRSVAIARKQLSITPALGGDSDVATECPC